MYTSHKLGQLALSMDKLESAQMVFGKCLRQNPNHWPSADGMLQVLCRQENFNEAYGWALMWFHKDGDYQRAIDVILEIRERFQHFGMEYIENSWNLKFDRPDLKRTKVDSVFPQYTIADPMDRTDAKPDYKPFLLTELSWLSIGTFIVNVYERYEATTGITYQMNVDELLCVQENRVENATDAPNGHCEENIVTDDIGGHILLDSKENSNSNQDCVFLVPANGGEQNSAEEDGDPTKAQQEGPAENAAAAKPKQCRRRGSDLSFLEQWGWHKNKRYVTRKKSLDRNDPDTTVNGILRRFLSKHFE